MGQLYRPRMLVQLDVPVPARTGDSTELVNFPVQVVSARLVQNDHNHADSLHVSMSWQDAGTDPRLIAGAIGTFYLGAADEFDNWEPGPDNLRFIGRMSRPMRRARGNEAMLVEAEFLDYTSFFLLAKPFATDGIPDYSQTLDEAWRRICENVPGAEELAEKIEPRGFDVFPKIGDAVAPRFAKLGAKVHVQPSADAWAVWQQCVGMCGLISFMHLDTCVVTTAEDLYTAGDPPVLRWGRDIDSISEERNNDFDRKGVGITSFDPETGKTLEALYPPVGDDRVKHKKISAKKASSTAALRAAEARDYFQFPGITEQPKLDALAKRVWEERSRQEMQGTFRTGELRTTTVAGEDFDMLSLRSGDVVRAELGVEDQQMLTSLQSESERVGYLVSRGYSDGIAQVMARNMSELGDLESSFYVKSNTISWEGHDSPVWIDVGFCNRILLSGGATT